MAAHARQPLDAVCTALYRQAATRGVIDAPAIAAEFDLPIEEVRRRQDLLTELNLLRPRAGRGHEVEVICPDRVAHRLLAPLEREILENRRSLDELRSHVESFSEIFLEARQERSRSDSVVVIDDPETVRLHLKQACENCTEEVLTMHAGGGRDGRVLAEALPRDLAMLENGVHMRVLYQHTARSSLATLSYVRQVLDAGAEVRTTAEIVERLIIFDGRLAFVPQVSADPPGATLVYEPALVEYLRSLFEHAWHAAVPLRPHPASYEEAGDELRASILHLMAQGLTDAVIARRLGMSARTCRRHVAEIMNQLGARSRFEAGVAAERSGLLADSGSFFSAVCTY